MRVSGTDIALWRSLRFGRRTDRGRHGSIKCAIVVLYKHVTPEQANEILKKSQWLCEKSTVKNGGPSAAVNKKQPMTDCFISIYNK